VVLIRLRKLTGFRETSTGASFSDEAATNPSAV
jgi:hypothetical protein